MVKLQTVTTPHASTTVPLVYTTRNTFQLPTLLQKLAKRPAQPALLSTALIMRAIIVAPMLIHLEDNQAATTVQVAYHNRQIGSPAIMAVPMVKSITRRPSHALQAALQDLDPSMEVEHVGSVMLGKPVLEVATVSSSQQCNIISHHFLHTY